MSIVTRSTHQSTNDERLGDWAGTYYRTGQHHRDDANLHYVAGGPNRYQRRHREPVKGCPQEDDE